MGVHWFLDHIHFVLPVARSSSCLFCGAVRCCGAFYHPPTPPLFLAAALDVVRCPVPCRVLSCFARCVLCCALLCCNGVRCAFRFGAVVLGVVPLCCLALFCPPSPCPAAVAFGVWRCPVFSCCAVCHCTLRMVLFCGAIVLALCCVVQRGALLPCVVLFVLRLAVVLAPAPPLWPLPLV